MEIKNKVRQGRLNYSPRRPVDVQPSLSGLCPLFKLFPALRRNPLCGLRRRTGLFSTAADAAEKSALAELPPLHNDPFDRVLAAQARSERMVLMTADPILERYPIEALWCGK